MKTWTIKYPFAAFVVLAFGLTWSGSLAIFLTQPAGGNVLPSLLNFPGALVWYYGPCLAGLIVTHARHRKSGLRQLWRRFFIWRVGWKMWAFMILYPLALHLAVVGIDWLLGGPAPVFFQAQGVPQGNPLLVIVGLIVFQFVMRGIGEETGWRGFALPYLQSRFSPYQASLVLGLVWAAWHFHPANFRALLSSGGVFIFLNIVLTTFIYTWFYNNTRGSLLVAALFHVSLNLFEYIIPLGLAEAGATRFLLQLTLILATILSLSIISVWRLGREVFV